MLLALSLIDINQNKIAGIVTSGFNISISSAHADEAAQSAEEKKAAAIKAKADAAEKLAAATKAKAEAAKAKAEAAKIAKAAAAVKKAAARKAKAEAAKIAKAAAAVKKAAAKKAKAEAAAAAAVKAAAAKKAKAEAAAAAAVKAAADKKAKAEAAAAAAVKAAADKKAKAEADAAEKATAAKKAEEAAEKATAAKKAEEAAAKAAEQAKIDADEAEAEAEAEDKRIAHAVPECSPNSEEDGATEKFDEPSSIDEEKDSALKEKVANTIETDFYILAFNYSRKDLLAIEEVKKYLIDTNEIMKQCELYNDGKDSEFRYLQGLGVIGRVEELICEFGPSEYDKEPGFKAEEEVNRKCHSKSLRKKMFEGMEQAATHE